MSEPSSTFWDMIVSAMGSKISILIAGFIGGVISLRFIDVMNTKERLVSVAISVILANYFAIPISNGLGASQYAEGCAAMIGLFGISTIGAIYKAIKELDIAAILKSRFGGGV